ncbi:MAG: tryptophan synthase subunit alpha [Oscillospiraceae bacterium]|jgi:tryptophan synthase alpha chain|nr:tryptophan synthase subunit alpha [Oscillospiraceae bacterium]
MSRIADAFENGKAFIAYLMAGDPDLETAAELIVEAQEAGADLIEIGIPFSDPIAEGEVIQQASIRALSAGTKLDGVFGMVASLKRRVRVPLVFMTYLNPVFVFGYERFFAKCREIGVCGIIIPDLPYEEQAEVKVVANQYGVELVTLIAPTSNQRIEAIAKNAEGFLYLVSSMGVTGMRQSITTDIRAVIRDIRAATGLQVAVGFGISSEEQVEKYSTIADGVIVGSAIVKLVGEYAKAAGPKVSEYIRRLKGVQRKA